MEEWTVKWDEGRGLTEKVTFEQRLCGDLGEECYKLERRASAKALR